MRLGHLGYTVSTYRQLALNVVGSVHKGDRVLVTGRLRIRQWGDGDRKGLNIDLDADALGHDLSWGKSAFTRSIQSSPLPVTTEIATSEGEAEVDAACEAEAESELDPATPF